MAKAPNSFCIQILAMFSVFTGAVIYYCVLVKSLYIYYLYFQLNSGHNSDMAPLPEPIPTCWIYVKLNSLYFVRSALFSLR